MSPFSLTCIERCLPDSMVMFLSSVKQTFAQSLRIMDVSSEGDQGTNTPCCVCHSFLAEYPCQLVNRTLLYAEHLVCACVHSHT